jgi:D-glycero-alpha-D-manno-heptose-7-phosphate kinase
MIERWKDLSESLTESPVRSSAPTRLPCGGSTDHRLTGLLCKSWQPVTANIAIDLRVNVILRPHRSGRIAVNIGGLGKQEFEAPNLPLTGPYALVSAVVCYFAVHGVSITIKTEFPFQSGLGGSGAVSIALIGAIYAASTRRVPPPREFRRFVQIAHHLEDSLFRNTGMQDQAAALYGGVNLWEWRYADRLGFRRRVIVSDLRSLNDHILVAYTGRPHLQYQNGSPVLEKFKETGAIDLLVSISKEARKFAGSLAAGDFRKAGKALGDEYRLRSSLLPEMVPDDVDLIRLATDARCGVSVTGHGGGGCMWAIGEKEDVSLLKIEWERAFEQRSLGRVLPVRVTGSGLEVNVNGGSER